MTEGEAGLMRAIDSLRNAEQHWFLWIDEDVLYLHAEVWLQRSMTLSSEDDLSSHLPPRVLPLSTRAPADIDFVVDRSSGKSETFSPLDEERATRHEAASALCSRWSPM